MAAAANTGAVKRSRNEKAAKGDDNALRRKRRVPHAGGRWSCLAYIPVPLAVASEIEASLQPVMHALSARHGVEWNSMLTPQEVTKQHPHVSVTTPLFIWRDELPAAREAVRTALSAGASSSGNLLLNAADPLLLPGGDGSITFMCATLAPHASGVVKRIASRCDAALSALGLPEYYKVSGRCIAAIAPNTTHSIATQDPIPHVSVAWCVGSLGALHNMELCPTAASKIVAPGAESQSEASPAAGVTTGAGTITGLVDYSSSSSEDDAADCPDGQLTSGRLLPPGELVAVKQALQRCTGRAREVHWREGKDIAFLSLPASG